MGYVYCSFPRVLPTGPSYFHDRMGFNVTIKLLNMGVHGMGVSVGAVVVDDEEEDDEEEEEEEEEVEVVVVVVEVAVEVAGEEESLSGQ